MTKIVNPENETGYRHTGRRTILDGRDAKLMKAAIADWPVAYGGLTRPPKDKDQPAPVPGLKRVTALRYNVNPRYGDPMSRPELRPACPQPKCYLEAGHNRNKHGGGDFADRVTKPNRLQRRRMRYNRWVFDSRQRTPLPTPRDADGLADTEAVARRRISPSKAERQRAARAARA